MFLDVGVRPRRERTSLPNQSRVHGQDDELPAGVAGPEFAQEAKPIHTRHREIEHSEQRPKLFDQGARFVGVASLAADGDAGVGGQAGSQPFPHNGMVIHQEDLCLVRHS